MSRSTSINLCIAGLNSGTDSPQLRVRSILSSFHGIVFSCGSPMTRTRLLLSIHQIPDCLLVTFPHSCSNLAFGGSRWREGARSYGERMADHWFRMRVEAFSDLVASLC